MLNTKHTKNKRFKTEKSTGSSKITVFKKKKKRIEQAKLREIYRIRVNRLELFSLFLVSIPSQELKLEIVERFVSEIDTNANQVQKRKKTKIKYHYYVCPTVSYIHYCR